MTIPRRYFLNFEKVDDGRNNIVGQNKIKNYKCQYSRYEN